MMSHFDFVWEKKERVLSVVLWFGNIISVRD
jgi:hypothetical protein